MYLILCHVSPFTHFKPAFVPDFQTMIRLEKETNKSFLFECIYFSKIVALKALCLAQAIHRVSKH